MAKAIRHGTRCRRLPYQCQDGLQRCDGVRSPLPDSERRDGANEVCYVTCNVVLKAAAHQTGRDTQEKTSWCATRFFLIALCCSRYEPCEVKRGPRPCLAKATLTTWMYESADQMVCPRLSEITDEAQAMADKKNSVQNTALPCKSGKTWWKPFKRRNSAFVSTLDQNVEPHRPSACLTTEQWTEFFDNHLKPGFEKAAYNPCHIWNENESGFLRQFSTVGQRVWVRKGRKTVAERHGWQRHHITAIVLEKETQPLSNPHECTLVLVDDRKRHLTLGGLHRMKSLCVEVVLPPPPSSRMSSSHWTKLFSGQ